MNFQKDLKIIDSFIGRKCERTLACNSLKIRFGEKTPYIWIEPPWSFEKNQTKVTASIEYPEDENEFTKWSAALDPLNETIFESFKYSVEDGLLLNFINGYSLHAPTTLEAIDEDDFYNHWYASE